MRKSLSVVGLGISYFILMRVIQDESLRYCVLFTISERLFPFAFTSSFILMIGIFFIDHIINFSRLENEIKLRIGKLGYTILIIKKMILCSLVLFALQNVLFLFMGIQNYMLPTLIHLVYQLSLVSIIVVFFPKISDKYILFLFYLSNILLRLALY